MSLGYTNPDKCFPSANAMLNDPNNPTHMYHHSVFAYVPFNHYTHLETSQRQSCSMSYAPNNQNNVTKPVPSRNLPSKALSVEINALSSRALMHSSLITALYYHFPNIRTQANRSTNRDAGLALGLI